FFALPAVISIVGLLVLNATLWVSFIDDAPLSTAIGLGTLASFVVTGGFAQAIGRRGLFYRLQGEHLLARTVSYYFVRVGCAVALVVAVLGLGVNTLFGILTPGLYLVALIYYWILSLLWLSLAVLYMLDQPLLFIPVVTLGMAATYALNRFGLPLVAQQSAA